MSVAPQRSRWLQPREVLHRVARRWRWFVPGIGVKRWALVVLVGLFVLTAGFLQFSLLGPWGDFGYRIINRLSRLNPGRWVWLVGAVFVVSGLVLVWGGVVMLNRSIVLALGAKPGEALDEIFNRRHLARQPRIVAVGGGTGLSNLLAGLKTRTANLTAIVAVSDDGGSSGRLREALDMPAPGDLTDCFAALSDSPLLAKLLTERFSRGDGLEGHTFGNLLLATVSEQRGFASGISAINEMLKVRGQVVPATPEAVTLQATLESGHVVAGERFVRERDERSAIARVGLQPENPAAMPEALAAIREADVIVVGPGSLYTSLIPPLLVPGVADAIRRSKAPLVYVSNIMTEHGETDGMGVFAHTQAVWQHLGRKPDAVLVNNGAVLPETLARYRAEQADIATPDVQRLKDAGVTVIEAGLNRDGGGQHNPKAVTTVLMRYSRSGAKRRG